MLHARTRLDQTNDPNDGWRNLTFAAALLAASFAPPIEHVAASSAPPPHTPQTSPSIPEGTVPAPESILAEGKLPPAETHIGPEVHTAAQLRDEAMKLAREYPDLATHLDFGRSVKGQPISRLRLSRDSHVEQSKPETLFIAGVHGDERVQPELLLALSRFLLSNYSVDERVRSILDNSCVSIVLCANPDGWDAGTRNNANDVDLNRDYPSIHSGRRISKRGRQPETQAIMELVADRHFNLLIDFHGTGGGRGVVFVNTPYDDQSIDNPAERFGDYQVAVLIAHAYAEANPRMRDYNNSYLCGGVTIGGGSAWFKAPTGPDCHAAHFDTTALTVEVSNPKNASIEEMREYFTANLGSMLISLEAAQQGYHLEVVDEDGKPITNATVSLSASTRNITFDDHLIHRLAPRGKHEVIVSRWGYEPAALWAESTRFDGSYSRVVLKRAAPD